MEHVVFWPGADGTQAFERTPSLDEAIQVVSRLRNDDGIEGARVYQLTEVPLKVRVEYKIEVPAETAAPAPAPAADPAPFVPLTPPIEDVVPAEALAGVPAESVSHLSVVRDDVPAADLAPAAEEPVAEVPAARVGDVLPEPAEEVEPAPHHRGRGIGFFSSNR